MINFHSKSRIVRYSKLEILMLDDNRLSDVAVFAALAGLKRYEILKILNGWKLEGFIRFSIYMYDIIFI